MTGVIHNLLNKKFYRLKVCNFLGVEKQDTYCYVNVIVEICIKLVLDV